MRALVLGSTGQTGSYLAQHLAANGYEVFAGVSMNRPPRDPFIWCDLLHPKTIDDALRFVKPDEIYNLAAITAPGRAWGADQPANLAEVTGLGVVRLMDSVLRICPQARVVHASSSAVFDPHRYGPYGISKRFAHDAVIGYRERLHCSNAVLYSHTSPRQDPRFLAPTLVRRLKAGERVVLTDILGRRDWGYAPDYARALQVIAAAEPGDYPVGTGRTRTVRDLVSHALMALGRGWDEAVEVNQGPVAPNERPADITALRSLGWTPETSFRDMVRIMVEAA